MSVAKIAAFAFFATTSVVVLWMLRDLYTTFDRGLTQAQIRRHGRWGSGVFGLWMLSVGLVILSTQDWSGALPLLIMGPVYILLGRFIWRWRDDHP